MSTRHYIFGDIRSDGRAYCKAHDSFESAALHPCFSELGARRTYRNELRAWCRVANCPGATNRPHRAPNVFIRKLR